MYFENTPPGQEFAAFCSKFGLQPIESNAFRVGRVEGWYLHARKAQKYSNDRYYQFRLKAIKPIRAWLILDVIPGCEYGRYFQLRTREILEFDRKFTWVPPQRRLQIRSEIIQFTLSKALDESRLLDFFKEQSKK